jgi:16S rRNA (adenine1518-N6/adenine1519-N6)-dimethyltransferase
LFSEFYLTVQQEFAERVVAIPGNKDYGSFSCFVQYYADAQMLFKIKRTSFNPAPKVDSCFLKLTMRPQPLWPARNESFLFQMIRLGFQQRRKTLVNALSTLMPKAELQTVFNQAGIGLDARAEVLGLERFVALSHLLLERHKK